MSLEWERRRFLREGLAAAIAFVAVGCSPSHMRARARNDATSTSLGTTSLPGTFAGSPVFGERMDVGTVESLRASIAGTHAPRYLPEARSYVVAFPPELVERARDIYPAEVLPVLAAGIAVLFQRCTHLGCRVPWCHTSEWFECPCHDAKFDEVGEHRSGPAPRGMDLVKASIERGRLVLDTGTILHGVPAGTITAPRKPAGPFCV